MSKPKIYVVGRIPGTTVEKLREVAEVIYYEGGKEFNLSEKELKEKYGEDYDLFGRELINGNLSPPSEEEFLEHAKNADIIIPHLTVKINKEIINKINPKAIVCYSAGFDNVDIKAATEKGIIVTNTPGVLHETVADHAMALILSLARKIPLSDLYARKQYYNSWGSELFLGNDVHHKNLGIIGVGQVGQAIVRRARGFGMTIYGFDEHAFELIQDGTVRPPEGIAYLRSINKLLEKSDFLIIACRYEKEGKRATHHLIQMEQLKKLGKKGFIINIARGPIIKQDDLEQALREKIIAGYGGDVFEGEHKSDVQNISEELINSRNNTVLTPHTASATFETRGDGFKSMDIEMDGMGSLAYKNAIAILEGKIPLTLVPSQDYETVIENGKKQGKNYDALIEVKE
jgi:glyoxylate reductase